MHGNHQTDSHLKEQARIMDSSNDAIPNWLSGTLQGLVEQMNLITQSLGMFEERLSHSELVLASLNRRLECVEASRTVALNEAHSKLISPPKDVSRSIIRQDPCKVPVTLASVAKLLQNDEES